VNALVFLFVVDSFDFGAMWHNKSPRSEREHESERPDRAVWFSRRCVKFPLYPALHPACLKRGQNCPNKSILKFSSGT
jgi:hypothetical protein